MDELQWRVGSQRDLRDCYDSCLTETLLSKNIPDAAIQPDGFTVHRLDRTIQWKPQEKEEVVECVSLSTTLGALMWPLSQELVQPLSSQGI